MFLLNQHFVPFLLLSNMLWCRFTTFCVPVQPTDEYLGCFQFKAHMVPSFLPPLPLTLFSFFPSTLFFSLPCSSPPPHPFVSTKVWNLWATDKYTFNFIKKIDKLFFKVVVLFYIPISIVWEFQLFHMLARSWYYIFNFSQCAVRCPCGLNFHFS